MRRALLAVVLLAAACRPQEAPELPRTRLSFPSGRTIEVEVAATPDDRQQGLMHRTRLGPEEGMLFVFPFPQPMQFWMKNTLIDLDMVFIAEDKRITEVHHEVPRSALDTPEANLARRSGYGLYVLELPAGTAKKERLQRGQVLKFQAAPAAR